MPEELNGFVMQASFGQHHAKLCGKMGVLWLGIHCQASSFTRRSGILAGERQPCIDQIEPYLAMAALANQSSKLRGTCQIVMFKRDLRQNQYGRRVACICLKVLLRCNMGLMEVPDKDSASCLRKQGIV